MKYIYKIWGVLLLSIFIGCGGGSGGGGGNSDKPVDITLIDGYIIDANMSDGDNTPVKYKDEKNIYHFFDTPQKYIKVNGGIFKESGLENKMYYNVSPEVTVISPIVHFLHLHPELEQTLAKALKVNTKSLKRDFIKENNLQVAKLAQIIYALHIHGLSNKFAIEVQNAQNYSDIVLASRYATDGYIKEDVINNFIKALDDKQNVANLEKDIYAQKKLMQNDVVIQEPDDEPSPQDPNAKGLEVTNVQANGNLQVRVVFSEAVGIQNETQKKAFTLEQIIHSTTPIQLAENEFPIINGSIVTLNLQNALETDNENNTYTISADNTLISSTGESLTIQETVIKPYANNLAIDSIKFKDSKNIQVQFNLPLSSSSINEADFNINGNGVSFQPSSVIVDPQDSTILLIQLANPLTSNIEYDLVIKNENLSDITQEKKIAPNASLSFISSPQNITPPSNSFYLMGASVDKSKQKVILSFSKPVNTDIKTSMFTLKKETKQTPVNLNIVQDNSTKNIVDLNVSGVENKLLSKENNSSYLLTIEKQTIFSLDGSRTLGTTFKKNFEITQYPKVTNASISNNSINITFNMPMEDINASSVTLKQGEGSALINMNPKVLGSGTEFIISDANGTEFNTSIVSVSIAENIFSKDRKSVLESTYTKDFNRSM